MEIRKIMRSELNQALQLVKVLAEYEKAPQEVTVTLEEYERDFDDNIFDAYVAVEHGKVLGLALYYIGYSTWKGKLLYLDDFIVFPEQRRRGLGKLLFEQMIEEAKEQQCNLVKWQVLDWNQLALDFYAKYEAIIEKEWWNGKILFEQAIAK